jgi:hypothetical protein
MEITSENIDFYGGVLINVEYMDGPISDMGEPHTVEIRTYQLPDGSRWEDEILNAPWQIGGNSGQVRHLSPL